MPIEPLPLPVIPPAPQRSDPATFEERNDAAVEFQFNVLPPWIAEQVNRTFKNALESAQYAGEAEADAERAEAAADAASQSAGATEWVSGKQYAKGDAVWSPIDLQTYRRRVDGSSTVDPSEDAATWEQIGGVHQGGSASLSRYDLSSGVVTDTLDLAVMQVFRISATSNRTISFANPPGVDRSMTVVVYLYNDSLPNRTINWPAGINWSGGDAPVLDGTKATIILFWTGDQWIGSLGALS